MMADINKTTCVDSTLGSQRSGFLISGGDGDGRCLVEVQPLLQFGRT